MCKYSGRLVAWLDRELTDVEATNVEWHVQQCDECRQAVAQYQEVSGAFLDCYQATVAPPAPAKLTKPSRARWAAGGLGIAAAILLAIFIRPPRAEQLTLRLPEPAPAPASAFVRSPMLKPAVHIRRAVTRKPVPETPVLAAHSPTRLLLPTVRVALPADALFPPGALPIGFSFIADVHPQP